VAAEQVINRANSYLTRHPSGKPQDDALLFERANHALVPRAQVITQVLAEIGFVQVARVSLPKLCPDDVERLPNILFIVTVRPGSKLCNPLGGLLQVPVEDGC
jgi:hypothetical protein